MKNRMIALMLGMILLLSLTTLHGQINWIRCADMPTAEIAHATAHDPTDDYIYSFGGYQGNANYSLFTYRYDPVADSWISMANMPEAICWINATLIQWNRKIYVLGGSDGVMRDYNFAYSIINDSWSTEENLPDARYWAGQVAYNDSLIYLIGGFDGAGETRTVQIYNTYADSWTVGTQLPEPCMMGGAVILGDTILLIDGYNASSFYRNIYYGFIDPLNCENITWNYIGQTSLELKGCTKLERESIPYLIWVNGDEYADSTTYVWELNLWSGEWTQLPNFPFIVYGFSIVSRDISEEVYICGGSTPGDLVPLPQVWKLSWLQGIERRQDERLRTGIRLLCCPNPFTTATSFRIIGTSKNQKATLTIFDSSGRLLKSVELTTNQYELGADLLPGVYFLKLNSKPVGKVVKVR